MTLNYPASIYLTINLANTSAIFCVSFHDLPLPADYLQRTDSKWPPELGYTSQFNHKVMLVHILRALYKYMNLTAIGEQNKAFSLA